MQIVSELRGIKSSAVRNQLRGIIAERGNKSLSDKTNNFIQQLKGSDYKAVVSLLSSLQRDGQITISLPVPPLPPAVGDIVFADNMPDKAFVSYARKVMHGHETLLINYINFTHELDALVDVGSDQEVANFLAVNLPKYGYSINLITRLFSIRYRKRNYPKVESLIIDFVSPLNNKRRSILFPAIEDSFDASRTYLDVRRTYTRIAKGNRLPRHVRLYIIDLFSPLSGKEQDVVETARAYAGYSIIDLCMYVISAERLAHASGRSFESSLFQALPNAVRETFKCARFPQHLFPSMTAEIIEEVKSDSLFRHSTALLNYDSAVEFRSKIECSLNQRLDGIFSSPVSKPPFELDKTLSPEAIIKSLRLDHLTAHNLAIPSAGRMELSGVFSYVVTNISEPLDLTGEELLFSLDACENVPSLLTSLELHSALPERSDDLLYELLRTTIIFDADQSLITDYSVRQATEKIVENHYDKDVLSLLIDLYKKAPSVGDYYFGFWDDSFLTQLYGLYDSVEAVSETRERMLYWYGDYTDSEIHRERARSLSLENKLVRLRNEIDANRLHVDTARLRHWMQDEVALDLRSLITSGDTILRAEANVSEVQDEILLLSDPGLQLARIVSKVFHEFCSNRSFGLDSYIGRRIRHGTFYGTITADVRTLLQNFVSEERERNPQLARVVAQRLRELEADVRRFAIERLQVRSEAKPKGLIVPSLDTDTKLGHLKLIYDDVEPLLNDTKNVPDIMELFQQHCWILIAPDLINIKQQLERYMTEKLFISSRDLPPSSSSAARAARLAIRDANAIVQQRVAQIASWFAQPPETLPSATLEELFQIVVEEARTQVSGYDPEVEIEDEAKIRLLGHRYQYVYDALYVVVKNAAFYGDKSGRLKFSTRKRTERQRVIVSVEISNCIVDSDSMSLVLERIDLAMSKTIDGAMVTEGKSGIPKLRSLENEHKEIRGVVFRGDGEMLTCGFEVLLASA